MKVFAIFLLKCLTNTSQCDILESRYIEVLYIVMKYIEVKNKVDDKIKRVYIPMTETGFYILFCLKEEMHGYNIVKKVEQMTNGDIKISAGTLYGSLSKLEKDRLIKMTKEENMRKCYIITPLGKEILEIELKRIERLYKNSKGELLNEGN